MEPLNQLKEWLRVGLPDPQEFEDVVRKCSEEELAEYNIFLEEHNRTYGSGFGPLLGFSSNR